jgi:hypothetical protein
MDRNNDIPLLLGHGLERLVSQDPGVRDEDMHAIECVEGSFHDGLSIFSRADGGYCPPTGWEKKGKDVRGEASDRIGSFYL